MLKEILISLGQVVLALLAMVAFLTVFFFLSKISLVAVAIGIIVFFLVAGTTIVYDVRNR